MPITMKVEGDDGKMYPFELNQEKKMSAEIVHVAPQPNGLMAFEPHGLEEAFQLAQRLVASGLLPQSIKKPEAALAIIIAGRELGLTAMQSLRSIYIIEGKPMLSADLMLALAKKSAPCKYFRLIESTAEKATYETLREGDPDPTRLSFTMEQAKTAGVTSKGNWKSYPDAMLRARCIAALARAVYPDLMMGVYEQDEIPRKEEYADNRRKLETSTEPVVELDPVEPDMPSAVEIWTNILASDDLTEEALADAVEEIKKEDEPIQKALRDAYRAAKKRISL